MAYKLLHSVGLPDSLVLLVESVDTVNHLLEQLDLAVAQPVLVGDVVCDPGLAAGLAPGAPGLQVELHAPSRQPLGAKLGPAREVDVDRGPHACAHVGGAGVDVVVPCVKHEVMARLLLDRVLHSLDSTSKSVKHLHDITAFLHGDDPELVLLVVPGQEGLVLVVEDATSLGPVTLHAGHLKVGVSRHEEEVVIDQLLPDLLTHAGEGEVSADQVSMDVLSLVSITVRSARLDAGQDLIFVYFFFKHTVESVARLLYLVIVALSSSLSLVLTMTALGPVTLHALYGLLEVGEVNVDEDTARKGLRSGRVSDLDLGLRKVGD